MSASLAVVPRSDECSQPDAGWAKKHISIFEIAKALGMRIRHRRVRCLRPENHAHGDADPSLHLYERGNTFRCFVCGLCGSNIDLVMGCLGIPFGEAVRWTSARFPVPNVKLGRPVGRRSGESVLPYRVGVSGSQWEVIVRSGMWGAMSAAERSILVVLDCFKDSETGITRMSYAAIMRYSGVASRTSVSKCLKQLARHHAIEVHHGARVGLVREASAYRVTLNDEKLLALCNEVFQRARGEIALEREYRAELRQARQRLNPRQVNKRTRGREEEASSLALRAHPTPKLPPSETHVTIEGHNLSPSSGLISNKPVHAVDREIGVLGHLTVEEQKRRGFLA